MKRFISLSERLILYFTLVGLSITIVLLTYSYFSVRSAILNRTIDQLTSVKIEKKIRIENFFADRVKEVEFFTSPNGIFYQSTFPLDDTIQLNKAIVNLLKNYNNIYLVGNNSLYQLVANKQPPNVQLARVNGKNSVVSNVMEHYKPVINIFISDYFIDEDDSCKLFIGSPVNNKFLDGFTVLFEIKAGKVNEIMLEDNPMYGLGQTGETYLVGSDLLMRSQSRFIKNSILNVKVNTQAMANALRGILEPDIIKDYRDIEVISTYNRVKIGTLNWFILSEMDYEEIMKPVDVIRNRTIFLSLIIFIIILYAAYFLSKRITLPIINLTKAINRVADGEYNMQLSIKSNDEIGVLTQTFNQMAIKLNQQSEELVKERNMRFRSLIDGQEMERQRLSRELHDGLGQSLIAIKLRLENIELCDSMENAQKIEKIKSLVNTTITEVKHMSDNLMPAVLKNFGVITAIRNICNEFSENSGIQIQFNYEPYNTSDELLQNYLFRIVQESLNNAVKHSGADLITVDLKVHDSFMVLSVKDNGKGMPHDGLQINPGNGLPNIKERVGLLKGTFNMVSEDNKGTELTIKIPIT